MLRTRGFKNTHLYVLCVHGPWTCIYCIPYIIILSVSLLHGLLTCCVPCKLRMNSDEYLLIEVLMQCCRLQQPPIRVRYLVRRHRWKAVEHYSGETAVKYDSTRRCLKDCKQTAGCAIPTVLDKRSKRYQYQLPSSSRRSLLAHIFK